jgi:16S rRNA A1518/A1519 N6-dimethyltransferase RsmA/KsgA/DIM1 with predicted DNA glycosylase/AP lyase activity
MRRKQIQNVLRSATGASAESMASTLSQVDIAPTARPENLSPLQFSVLFDALGTLAPTRQSTDG